MASLNDLQKKLSLNLKKNAATYSKEISGYTIEECIKKAEILFQVPESDLEYEIIERGGKGVLGIGKKLYKVCFKVSKDSYDGKGSPFALLDKENKEENTPIDGKVRIIIRKIGVFLKVSPPKNNGNPANYEDVLIILNSKSYRDYNSTEVKGIVEKATDKPARIGDYIPSPNHESRVELKVSEDEMKAYITITKPILAGRILEEEEVLMLLDSNNIVFNVKNNRIKETIEEEHYNTPILIAEGLPPQRGKDAYIEYHFKTDNEIHFEEDESGKVDFFSDFGLIQNVVAGQILATKVNLTSGTPGKTITNKEIPVENGKDIEFNAGKNTALSDNGLEIIAQHPGRVVIDGDIVEVEPMYEVKGNVGLKTGNITFLGDVSVFGNVEDGFSIKAAGNIHIGGTIGKAIVEADGDVVVKRGILGKEEGLVRAGGNVYAKFIENSKIIAALKVVAGEGILHSQVDAKKVFSLGKRGTITGGHIRTVEEVNAKTIGSASYTETKVETGVDPVAKEKLAKFDKEREAIEENLNKIIPNLTTIQNQKRAQKSLPPEREVMLQRMLQARSELENQLKEIQFDIDELKTYLNTLSNQGKISAKDKVYPGSEITIRNALLKIKNDFTYVTFIIEGGEVKPLPYQEPKEPGLKVVKEKRKRRK